MVALLAILSQTAWSQITPTLPEEPQFPDDAPVYNVKKYGARGVGITDDTNAIQSAIDACAEANDGGTVLLPKGIYLTKTIQLKSNMTLKIDEGATLRCTGKQEDFPPCVIESDNCNWGSEGSYARAFIYAYQARNVRITGPGTINGNGYASAWSGQHELGRPIPIYMVQCERVLLDNFLLKDGAMWNIVPMETDDFTMRSVEINANIIPNRDGIDIVDCHRVLVEDCTFYTDDDCICPKSGHSRGVEDVTVRHCSLTKSGRANGIKFGTMSYGGFKRMLFHDITMRDVNLAGIAIESVDGADISEIEFRDIEMDGVGIPIFIILGNRGNTMWHAERRYGTIDNVLIKNVTAVHNRMNYGAIISGTRRDGRDMRVKNVTLEGLDVSFTGGLQTVPKAPSEYDGRYPESTMWGETPVWGFYIRHADGINLKDCRFVVGPADARKFIVSTDATVNQENVTVEEHKMENVANAMTYLADDGLNQSILSYLWDGSTADGNGFSTHEGYIYFDLAKHYQTPVNLVGGMIWQDGGGAHVDKWRIDYWNGSDDDWNSADLTANEWQEAMPLQDCTSAGYQYGDFTIAAKKLRLYIYCKDGNANLHEFSAYSNDAEVRTSLPAIGTDDAQKGCGEAFLVDGKTAVNAVSDAMPKGLIYIRDHRKYVAR